MYVRTLSARVVLFIDLFHAIDHAYPNKDQQQMRDTIPKAVVIFATQVASPPFHAVIEQGQHILAGLFAAEESRRVLHATRTLDGMLGKNQESFAQVLKRTLKKVAAKEAFVPRFALPPGSLVPPSAFTTLPGAPMLIAPAHQQLLATTTLYTGMTAMTGMTLGRDLAGAARGQAGGYHGWEGGRGQDFTSFFSTLARKDWGAREAGL